MSIQRFIAVVLLMFAIFGFAAFGSTVKTIYAQQSLTTFTPQEDTVTILQNPMMGFQDHDVTRSWWPSSTGYIRAAGTCLLNGTPTACGSLSWDKLNPQKGTYNFADLDLFLDNMKAQKKFAGFRVRTVVDTSSSPTIPAWASAEGVTSSWGQEAFGGRSGVEIDYQKCVFLDEWATFAQALIARYDNNPTVSFVDIGGYGWYGEWWSGKTVPQRYYSSQIHDTTDPTQQQSWDLRLRIIRMFTGGSGSGHCIDNAGNDIIVSYSYQGFKNKPVLISRGDEEDVANGTAAGAGIRYDGVGATNTDFRAKVGSYIASTWKNKPIMGEFVLASTAPRNTDFFNRSLCFVREYHISSIHNNDGVKPTVDLDPLFRELGYRLVLNNVTYPGSLPASSQQQFSFAWVNKGTSPAYSRYPVVLTFKPAGVDSVAAQVVLSNTDVRQILPADVTATSSDYLTCTKGTPTVYTVNENITIPALTSGNYDLYIGMNEPVYQNPIQLALLQKDTVGRYLAGHINVQGTSSLPATNTPFPTLVIATNTPQPTTQPTSQPATNTPVPATNTPLPTIAPTNTPQPTFQPATNTPIPTTIGITSTPTALSTSTQKVIEAESTVVQHNGNWTVKSNVSGASGMSYLLSSGSKQDSLSVTFTGTSVSVMYVMGPTLGTINVYVDGNFIQGINTTATTTTFGQSLKIANLVNKSHTVKVTTAKGTIALDAFIVS